MFWKTQKDNNLAERLGYPSNAKLLIIHADDMGMSHSINHAVIQLFEQGTLSSASVMVPCPYFPEVAEWGRMNPAKDIGIHLTLTSEWETIKWNPVLTHKVPSLTNSMGCFFRTTKELEKTANTLELEKELKAQIEKGLDAGLDITHIDSHGFSLMANLEFQRTYLKLGQEYQIPVLIKKKNKRDLKLYLTDKDVFVDYIFMASNRHYKRGIEKYYAKVLNNLSSGLNIILIHPSFNDKEMRHMTQNHDAFNAKRRQDDFDFFISDQCQEIIKRENIYLVSWREIRDRISRSKEFNSDKLANSITFADKINYHEERITG